MQRGDTAGERGPHPDGAPDVSVIIAAWRAEATLERAVASALAQTGLRVEVLVVDDASPDGTAVLADRLAQGDARVRLLRLTANGGPSAARNAGLAAAAGDWVAVLDADDAMVPRRLERMLALAQETGADIVLGNLAEVDADGRSVAETPFLVHPDTPAPVGAEAYLMANMRAAGPRTMGYLKPLLRRALLERTGLRYDHRLRNGEDFHLILAALLAGAQVWFSPDPDYLYTRGAGSVSDRIALGHLACLIDAERSLAAQLADRPRLAALLHQRGAELADLMTAETVLRAIKARRIDAARQALVLRPRAAVLVLRQAGEGLLRRLRRQSGASP